jgi:calreticulin
MKLLKNKDKKATNYQIRRRFFKYRTKLSLKSDISLFFFLSSIYYENCVNRDKPLVIQFTVKHEQNIDCGGGYVKLFDCKLNQADMHGDSPYNVMFGPDICGPGTKKVHVIFSHKGKNHLVKKVNLVS